ncbi:MAG: sigma-70 family RNA polymerase sigma factor [Acidithiobacillus sp.]|nr:sigma-70 family RNA polymerase sigma factor [Acidithiobacillus sp.]
MTLLDDAMLVAQAQSELPYRTEAYTNLVRRHGRKIRSLAQRFTADSAEAEDLTQEILLRVYVELPRFRGESGFSTWLWRLATHLCIDHQRRTAARPKTENAESLVENTMHPIDRIAAIESRLDAERLLKTLDPEDRSIVLLRLLMDLEFREIAAILDSGLSATKMRYSRAIEKLRSNCFQERA